jgi:hypothetical protein
LPRRWRASIGVVMDLRNAKRTSLPAARHHFKVGYCTVRVKEVVCAVRDPDVPVTVTV